MVGAADEEALVEVGVNPLGGVGNGGPEVVFHHAELGLQQGDRGPVAKRSFTADKPGLDVQVLLRLAWWLAVPLAVLEPIRCIRSSRTCPGLVISSRGNKKMVNRPEVRPAQRWPPHP